MAYRFTNTDKWHDSWFSGLKQLEMLLFIYLCDNCDIAGFIEINYKRWSNDLGSSIDTIKGACKGLERGLVFSQTGDCIFIKNYIKHQKNLPLNELNKAHLGILKRFDLYIQKFDVENYMDLIQGASKGLPSPIGNGNGNGIDILGQKIDILKTWKNDFEIYKEELKQSYLRIVTPEYLKRRQEFHPNIDIKKTLGKSIEDFWIKEAGWNNKKDSRSKEIDWERTFNNSLSQKMNWVYLPKK